MADKKSLVEEALLQMKNLEQVVAENAKGILASTMKEEISELVKESLKEAEEESNEMEMDEQPEMDVMTIDMDSEESDDESEEMINMDSEDDMDDMESEDEMDFELSMDDEEEDEQPIDLRNASTEEILKVFKKMGDEDGIIVTQDDEDIHLTDNDEDVEYIIQTEGDDESDEEVIDEEMHGEEMEENISDEELDSMMDSIFQESEMEEEDSMEEDEVVYEIEMDMEDDEMEDSEMDEEYMEEEDMMEAIGFKPVMGHTKKSTLTNKAKKMETKEGDMMTKPVVGKGVKTGKPDFEFKEGKKMETKEEVIEPKGSAKGVNMNLKPKKFEYTEAKKKQGYDAREDEREGMKHGKIAGKDLKTTKARRDDAHFETRKKGEHSEAARTLGNGTRNYPMRKGLPKMKVIPNEYLQEEVERLRNKNDEYRKALNVFREKLNEVAVFNSNLAYATRLFTEHTTTKQEKINILRRFDDVESLKESKNLYGTIKNELNTQVQSVVTESIKEIDKSPASGSSQNLIESKTYENPQFLRMKDIMSKINR
jgi:hypothetical protein